MTFLEQVRRLRTARRSTSGIFRTSSQGSVEGILKPALFHLKQVDEGKAP